MTWCKDFCLVCERETRTESGSTVYCSQNCRLFDQDRQHHCSCLEASPRLRPQKTIEDRIPGLAMPLPSVELNNQKIRRADSSTTTTSSPTSRSTNVQAHSHTFAPSDCPLVTTTSGQAPVSTQAPSISHLHSDEDRQHFSAASGVFIPLPPQPLLVGAGNGSPSVNLSNGCEILHPHNYLRRYTSYFGQERHLRPSHPSEKQ